MLQRLKLQSEAGQSEQLSDRPVTKIKHPAAETHSRFSRREILRMGLTGFTGLTLGQLYQIRAQADSPPSGRRTAVILVWLRGGASHLETFDPKPHAPSDFRGPYHAIATNVPGIHISELLPRLATIADKYAILRSIAHTGGGHPAGSLQVLSGDTDSADKLLPTLPDWMSVAHFLRSDRIGTLPNYVAVNPSIATTTSPSPVRRTSALRTSHSKLPATRINRTLRFPAFELERGAAERLRQRSDLKQRLDVLRSDIDQSGVMDAFDAFHAQALNLLTSAEARDAFDLSKEPDHVRDRYGRNQWGQQCLMARRLVEAGVEIIATEFDGPLCGRVQNWDDHAVNHHVFDALKFRLPFFDQAVSALIEDIYSRGLDRRVLVVVAGEFGRTPRISYVASSGAGEASGPSRHDSAGPRSLAACQFDALCRRRHPGPDRSSARPTRAAKSPSNAGSVREISWRRSIGTWELITNTRRLSREKDVPRRS